MKKQITKWVTLICIKYIFERIPRISSRLVIYYINYFRNIVFIVLKRCCFHYFRCVECRVRYKHKGCKDTYTLLHCVLALTWSIVFAPHSAFYASEIRKVTVKYIQRHTTQLAHTKNCFVINSATGRWKHFVAAINVTRGFHLAAIQNKTSLGKLCSPGNDLNDSKYCLVKKK